MAAERRRKQLARLEKNPKAVSPESLDTVLRAFDYDLRRQKGSHRTYGKEGAYPITVPYRRPHVKQVYVEQVIERLRGELRSEESTKEDSDGVD